MSLSSELCTSFGGLNTGGNLSESSLLFFSPTDFTEFHRSLPYAGWDFADNADDADFFLHLIYHPSRFSDINLIRC